MKNTVITLKEAKKQGNKIRMIYDAVCNAGRIMKEGRADAVKLEGGVNFKEHIKAIVNASIPVVGHIGLTPQSVNAFGGMKVQGKNIDDAKRLLADIKAVEEAGACAVVIECVPAKLAAYLTSQVSIPTIGIGAGAGCDGQVLVYTDMLGTSGDFTPKFVKKFAQCGDIIKQAVASYIDEVKQASFPDDEHAYKMDEAVIAELKK